MTRTTSRAGPADGTARLIGALLGSLVALTLAAIAVSALLSHGG